MKMMENKVLRFTVGFWLGFWLAFAGWLYDRSVWKSQIETYRNLMWAKTRERVEQIQKEADELARKVDRIGMFGYWPKEGRGKGKK